MLKEGKLYPVEYQTKLRLYNRFKHSGIHAKHPVMIMAESTGEFRNPLKNEYYLSGAIPQAYNSPNDLSNPYHIAKIVLVKEVKTLVKINQEECKKCYK